MEADRFGRLRLSAEYVFRGSVAIFVVCGEANFYF